MRALAFFSCCFLFALPAFASSPGMVEGPPGCSWNGTVAAMGDSNAGIRLDTLHGTCMSAPGPCGKEGDVVTVDTDASEDLTMDAIVQVWVAPDGGGVLHASLKHPECTRNPIPSAP